jgi:molybdate transport system substrate-binding protein
MDEVVDAGETSSEPQVFALNRLQIAVPAGNPGRVSGLEDFSNADLLLGVCARGVPCGDFARQSLAKAGVDPELDTAEPNVRALLVKIEAGELDAGITYVTDVVASTGSVEGIEIPVGVNVTAEYPIAALADAPNPDMAADFVSFVQSEPGREILESRGFTTP